MTRKTMPRPAKTRSEKIVPRIDTTNATTDDFGPAAYVALVSSSVHEML
jgi:hypothetical protein